MSRKRTPLLLVPFVAAAALAGCATPHYSVAVATSESHVLYGQRHPETSNDYLVDCQIGPDRRLTNCQTIELKSADK
ncbi:MAG: hypothetical protein ACYTGC_05230 [Planctomycetota bacterium]|jgi:hypothetical protein